MRQLAACAPALFANAAQMNTLGRLGWFMAVIYYRLVPGIEKYHEVIKNDIQDFVINS